jgi:hypothetical protein
LTPGAPVIREQRFAPVKTLLLVSAFAGAIGGFVKAMSGFTGMM